ncbi:hypothetical protein I315_06818, partial [Cryptococcus gattii Ru294]
RGEIRHTSDRRSASTSGIFSEYNRTSHLLSLLGSDLMNYVIPPSFSPFHLSTLYTFRSLKTRMGIEVTGVKQVTCFTSQATWNTLKHWLLETRENRPPVFR